MAEIVRIQSMLHEQKMNKVRSSANEKKLNDYKGEYNLFVNWCTASQLQIDFDAAEQYLLYAVTEQGVKLNTYNRKRAALKFYLMEVHGLEQSEEHIKNLKAIRDLYKHEDYIRKSKVEGVRAEDKKDVLEMVLTLF